MLAKHETIKQKIEQRQWRGHCRYARIRDEMEQSFFRRSMRYLFPMGSIASNRELHIASREGIDREYFSLQLMQRLIREDRVRHNGGCSFKKPSGSYRPRL